VEGSRGGGLTLILSVGEGGGLSYFLLSERGT